jgi:tripartite-type tricarboxylate transporter receptor subunit TctC
MMTSIARVLIAALTLGTAPAVSLGQVWPTQPIRLIVGAASGGGVDMIARTIAEPLTKRLGVSVVVDNRGGAGGNIAAEQVVRSAPDGYTLLVASNVVVISPAMYKSLSYNVERDLEPISLVATSASVLAAKPDFRPSTVPELIRAAKAAPGTITFGSSGIGTSNHLAGELLKALAGIDLVHVPFKGAGPALQSLLGGQIDLIIGTTLELAPRIRNGKVKGIAVTNALRSPALPDVPTIGESVPGYESTIWISLFAPVGMSRAIVTRLVNEVASLSNLADVKGRLENVGATLVASAPDVLARTLREDIPKWIRVTKQAGIVPE